MDVPEDWARELMTFNGQAGAEDDALTDSVQRGLLGGLPTQGRSLVNREHLVIHFQNEALMAIRDGEAVVSVPDLIVVLDAETGQPITTEALRYGFRVVVLAIPCDPKWRTPAGLALVGPRYFGYDVDYAPALGL